MNTLVLDIGYTQKYIQYSQKFRSKMSNDIVTSDIMILYYNPIYCTCSITDCNGLTIKILNELNFSLDLEVLDLWDCNGAIHLSIDAVVVEIHCNGYYF